MRAKQAGHRHFVVLDPGEEVVEGINAYVRKHGIRAGSIQAIGAVDNVGLRLYSPRDKKYIDKDLDGMFEILNVSGNVAVRDGQPAAHVHITLGDADFLAIGGHLRSATVSVTCEIIIDASDATVERVEDETIGLAVWKP